MNKIKNSQKTETKKQKLNKKCKFIIILNSMLMFLLIISSIMFSSLIYKGININKNREITPNESFNKNKYMTIDDIDSDYIKKTYNPENTEIPEKFNLNNELKQKYNIDVGIENQKNLGLCNTFAIIKSMETNHAIKTGNYINLSERYVSYMLSDDYYTENGYAGLVLEPHEYEKDAIATSTIHSTEEPMAILESIGTTTEKEIPYINYNKNELYQIENATPILKIDGYIHFPIISWPNIDDQLEKQWMNIMKIHIMKYGALIFVNESPEGENYNTTYNTYNNQYKERWDELGILGKDESTEMLHVLNVIGWDDNYPKENFNIQPQNNGAWILQNSWGSEWGDNGYYYISYESDNIDEEILGILNTEKANLTSINHFSKKLFNSEEYTPPKEKRKYYGLKFENEREGEYIDYIIAGIKSDQLFSTINVYINKYDDTFDFKKTISLKMYSQNRYYSNIKLETPIKIESKKYSIIFEIIDEVKNIEDIKLIKTVPEENSSNIMYSTVDIKKEWIKEENTFPVYVFKSSE